METSLHAGRSLAGLGRLLALERAPPNSDTVFMELNAKLKKAEQERDRLVIENFTRQNLNSVIQAELKEAHRKNEKLQVLVNDLGLQVETLEQTHEQEQSEHLRIEKLQTEQVRELEQKNKTAEKEIEDCKTNLRQLQEAHNASIDSLRQSEQANKEFQQQQTLQTRQNEELQNETENLKLQLETLRTELKTQNQSHKLQLQTLQTELQNASPTEQQRQEIISEYRASSELTQEILDEFGKGYSAAMAKVEAAGIDLRGISFSDDEDDDAPDS